MPRLAALVFTVLLAAGCGDDGGSTESGAGSEISVETGTGSKAEFIKRADAICRARSKKTEAEFASFLERNEKRGASPDSYRDAAEQVVETIYLQAGEAQIDRIGSLGAPVRDEGRVVAFLEAFQRGLDEAQSHPLRFVRALNADYAPFAKAEELAAAYGFSECGKG
jgi:hypothetical protein